MTPHHSLLLEQVKASTKGETASRIDNDLLYPRVAAGDREAMTKMIESNVPFVVNKVDTFIRCFPSAAYLRDDLIAEGMMCLCKAVSKMAEDGVKENANATGYISYWIHKGIGLVVDSEAAAGPNESERTRKRKASDGEPIGHRVELTAGDGEFFDLSHPIPDTVTDPMSIPDLKDLIYSCCETEVDRMIVELREQNYTYHEVAKIIELPYTATYMLLRAIYARFLLKSGMKGEA